MPRTSPRTTLRAAAAALTATAAVAALTGTTVGAQAHNHYGPPYNFTTELMGDGSTVIPLKNQAMISRTKHGYRFRSGQQNGRLTVTEVPGGVKFVDRGTARWRSLADACKRIRVSDGVGAVCRIPGGVTTSQPLLLEIWPRLGNDVTDTSRLSARFAAAVLADAGADTTRVGAGDDFVNAAQGNDLVYGNGGNDWLRGGRDRDKMWGGPQADKLVGGDHYDVLYGGDGRDQLGDARDARHQ